MRPMRLLAGLLSAALLATPGLVLGAGTASATETLSTKVTIATSYKVMQYKTQFEVSGTLTAYDSTGTERSLSDAQTVTLERRFPGSATWTPIDSYDSYGNYYFSGVVGLQNATYRVSFAGGTQYNSSTGSDDTLAASSASASVRVARKLGDRMVYKGSRVYLRGHVTPGAHRVVVLQRKKCKSCGWRNYAQQRSSSTGAWGFRLGAPRRGKWLWRAYVAKSTDFIKSWSDYIWYTRVL